MKTATKIATGVIAIMLSVILLFTALIIGNTGKVSVSDASTRTIELAENSLDNKNLFDEFDSVNVSRENYVFTYTAVKSFDDLSAIDNIGYDEDIDLDELEIEYTVVCNAETGIVELSAETVIDNEQVIDTIAGKVYYNEDNNIDVAFNIDGTRYSVRELLNASALDECSIGGNILHALLNTILLSLTVVEPALKITIAAAGNALSIILGSFQLSYLAHYNNNKKLTHQSGFITNQHEAIYAKFAFGSSDLSYAGCEVIAGYNLAYALGKNISLAEVTYLYEYLGIEVGVALGFFGSNPYQIGYFLDTQGIKYTKVTSYSSFKSYANNSTQYHMIVSRWNNTSAKAQIHTYYVDKLKDPTNKMVFRTYNMKSDTSYKDKSLVDELFNEKPSDTFMVAYIINK